jgi:RND family efflux transporter MFP subunit
LSATDTGRKLQRAAIIFAIVLLIAFLLMFIVKAYHRHVLVRDTARAAGAVPLVDIIRVRGSEAGGALTVPGETAAWYESTIFARVSGYVVSWHADIGDHVKSEEVLARIDTPELDAELQAAEAKLQVAKAQVKVKEADAAFAKSTYERWRDSPKGVVSDQEREDKKAGDAAAAAQLDAARAQVVLDQADVDRLSAFEKFKLVTAPYAGTVVERRIDIGNLVTAGSAAGNTPLYRMSQDDPIRVLVDVPQSAAPDLMKNGVPAQILVNDSPAGVIAGHITRTSDAINPQARTFRAELDIPNPHDRLVPGLYVQVAFQLQNGGLLSVPAAALTFSAEGPRVAVVGSDHTVHFRAVTIARDDGDRVQLASGVSSGDELVLNISNQIAEGQKVEPRSDAPSAPLANSQVR